MQDIQGHKTVWLEGTAISPAMNSLCHPDGIHRCDLMNQAASANRGEVEFDIKQR